VPRPEVPQGSLFCYPDVMGESSQTGGTSAAQAMRALEESVRDCNRCGLCGGRTQVVFGVGSPEAELMFVGEGPGYHEDRQGEPFVGAAGKLLTELLGQIGLTRADVYIANVVKCRPPDNRDPLPEEIEACSPHLMDQIATIRPRVICTLGRFATKLLADTELSMTAIHGRAKQRDIAGVGLIVFPVFHPAAALYTPSNRQVLEQDFAKLRHLLSHGLVPREEGPEKAGDGSGGPAGRTGGDAAGTGGPAAGTCGGVAGAPVDRSPAPAKVEQLPLW
jgi:uracil-DNA glycosylase